MYSYQKIDVAFFLIFTLLYALLIISSKEKSSATMFRFFKIGGGVMLISLLMAWVYSREPIYNLATFKAYYFSGGFGKFYMLGLSILCAIPIAAIYNALYKFILCIYNKNKIGGND